MSAYTCVCSTLGVIDSDKTVALPLAWQALLQTAVLELLLSSFPVCVEPPCEVLSWAVDGELDVHFGEIETLNQIKLFSVSRGLGCNWKF